MTTASSGVRDKLFAIEAYLNTKHIDRAEVIHMLVLALISMKHVLLLGPPGNDKSRLLRHLFDALIGARVFKTQLDKTSGLDMLMGSIDIEARMRNVVRYETKNMLPEATHALIEEVNEASGWTKKGMLDILSEPSVYKNEGVEHLSDLQVVVGSTNNWHDQKTEAAFGDRFPIRMVLGYLNTPEAYRMLLELPDNGVASPDAPTVTLEELAIAQDEVKNIPFSPDAADVFVRVRERFHDEDIVVSDRRWYQSRAVWRAEAWMRDGLEVEPDDLLAGKHTLWVDPDLDHRLKVASILEELCSIDNERAQEIERAVVDAWDDRPTELALLNEQVVKTRSALKDVSRLRKRSSIVTSATMTIEDMLKRFETEVEIGDEREQRRVEAEQLETARTDQIQTMRTRANADARRRRS